MASPLAPFASCGAVAVSAESTYKVHSTDSRSHDHRNCVALGLALCTTAQPPALHCSRARTAATDTAAVYKVRLQVWARLQCNRSSSTGICQRGRGITYALAHCSCWRTLRLQTALRSVDHKMTVVVVTRRRQAQSRNAKRVRLDHDRIMIATALHLSARARSAR